MDASPSLLMARCGHRMKVARLQGSPIAACARSEEPEFVRSIRQRSLLARRGLRDTDQLEHHSMRTQTYSEFRAPLHSLLR